MDSNLLVSRPDLEFRQLQRTRDLMNSHVMDCLVTDYEELVDTLILPDPADRHVLAAAIKAGASIILTFNLKDFPPSALAPFNIEACHPDKFLTILFSHHQNVICSIAKSHRMSLKNPPKGIDDYLATLEQQGLVGFVKLLRQHSDSI